MLPSDEYWIDRLRSLLQAGESLLASSVDGGVESRDFLYWRSRSSTALAGLLEGTSDSRAEEFIDVTHDVDWLSRPHVMASGLGILEGVVHDLEEGHLTRTLAGLVSAENFSSFLSQARHQLENGFAPCAGFMATAVLEQHARRLVGNRQMSTDGDLGSFNDRLRDKAYSATEYKIIRGLIGLRNDLDHGNWDEVTEQVVGQAIDQVERIIAQYPA